MFGHFAQLDNMCCRLNLDCQSICCMDNVCVPREPCPHYDGSIEKWEEYELNQSIDDQIEAVKDSEEALQEES